MKQNSQTGWQQKDKRKNIKKTYKTKIMKTSTTQLFSTFSQQQVEKLTSEVKETLARVFNQQRSKRFGTADLWNIERRRRTLAQRRHCI